MIHSATSDRQFDAESSSVASSSDGMINKKTKWQTIQGNLEDFWITKQILPKDADKTKVVKTTLRELLTYIAFLVTITYITFSMMNPTMYYQTKIMSNLFLDQPDSKGITFRMATQMDHFWDFVEGPLIHGLYWDKWYNNETASSFKSILYENYLLGAPRMRQIRVRNDSCEIHKDFQRAIFSCYNHYSKIYEDRDDIHEKHIPEFEWQEIRSFAKNDVWGQLSTYSGEGGYIVNLSLNKTIAIKTIEKLKEFLWIDRGTRAVLIDFTTYNPNINLYVVTKLIAEFPATGGMFTSWQFRTLNLLENSSQAQIGLYVCFIMFLIFIVYYTIEEFFEITALGFIPYLRSSGWNYLDLFIILISLALVFFLVCRKYIITKIFDEAYTEELAEHGYMVEMGNRTVSLQIDTYQFDTLGFWSAQFSNILAVLSFVSWIKIFKYISFNKTMSQLSSTLSRCAKDIAGFGLMFFIVFFAFAQLGYLLFGTQVKDYSSFGRAVFTLLRLILGDFDFQAIENANRVLGPIFFLSYIFFVFFVLMNMFLAIINDTYAEVKSELKDDEEFAMMDYFKAISNQILHKLGTQKEQIEEIQQAIKQSGFDGSRRVSFSTIRQELKKRNLSDQEIEMLFAKYDIDQNRELDETELHAMFEDLEGKKKSIEKEMEENKNKRRDSVLSLHGRHLPQFDFGKISKRVDRMEYVLATISNKMDSLFANRIENDD
ncbi:polycystin-2-like protein 1 [Dermatophagoides farinae]|uniref:Polycystic kidney disease 2-like 1 protein n=1 Tax=Dermatophagoides farinae TaxID=6954 RepID=A0A922IBF5_DERFA|nr:polycystic kidney disease 2-like 1 protein [Dermatophagoides farinae]KAH7636330.1 polycystic kidney disease 2-like 1 protein [Dermatophagoides farinae]KAH9528394.1 TRP-like ion channel Pkd2 [Dermatophagoides farinae]